jgi:hypothetical protein
MAQWVECTAKSDGRLIYVNIDLAMSIGWNDEDERSYIAFPGGGPEDVVLVKERPEDILK